MRNFRGKVTATVNNSTEEMFDVAQKYVSGNTYAETEQEAFSFLAGMVLNYIREDIRDGDIVITKDTTITFSGEVEEQKEVENE